MRLLTKMVKSLQVTGEGLLGVQQLYLYFGGALPLHPFTSGQLHASTWPPMRALPGLGSRSWARGHAAQAGRAFC